MKWLRGALRRFDLEHWQMREALGHPIPNWVDRKWPRQFDGNLGRNPHRCGTCDARRRYPAVASAPAPEGAHLRCDAAPSDQAGDTPCP
jgi:hypothetical protein